ncbi:ATP-binding protein [Methylobacterium segetis]|uniref:ATP-binding protein n=1 Tax=Methylobacterium segetis TaxID=2488750 RepID=UPI0014050935|nr:ATP-binding protein [Methylobacterium segetis]
MSLRARLSARFPDRLPWHRSLFRKYVLTLVSLVALVLSINAGVETWILYRETVRSVARAQGEYAQEAERSVEAALGEIERQVSWVTRASAVTLQQHRDDYELLLQQAPGVLTLAFIDASGRVQVRSGRPGGAAAGEPLPTRPGFAKPVFRDGRSLAALVVSHAWPEQAVTVAEVGLEPLADALPAATPGSGSYAYLVDTDGRVLGRTAASPVAVGAEVARAEAAGAEAGGFGRSPDGRAVLRTLRPVAALPAGIVVEQPLPEALAPIRELLLRLAWLFAFGLVVAICASLVLARRMVVPIRALHAGAEHLAANRFDHRIAIRTGDEFEALADSFNRMADELSGSYGRLEVEIEKRTRDLARSVSELRALEETGRAIVGSLDLDAVTAAIAARASALTGARTILVYLRDEAGGVDGLAAAQGVPDAARAAVAELALAAMPGSDAATRGPLAIPDLSEAAWFPGRAAMREAGLSSGLALPLSDAEGALGLVLVLRAEPGPPASPDVMQSFAHQAALAIRNARLFQEVDAKNRELAAADRHKTHFFANMSHELRTPLNAVLGYSELLVDGLYGPLSDKALDALERIQINGRHLLSLINDVLDFTKIEAGSLTLSMQDYSMPAMIEQVVAAAASLAHAKNLALTTEVAEGLPVGQGDERRLTQVLMNLVGNAIKFTESGEVRVAAKAAGGWFTVSVTDTGPGIAAADQGRIFDEFQQIDSSSTRKQGGTGLGLSIARKLVLLHGGRIDVESEPGRGAVFRVHLPVRASEERQAA